MTVEDKSASLVGLDLVTSLHNKNIDSPEGHRTFFDSVMDKSVAVLKDGFTLRSPGVIFTRVLTKSHRYVFDVEMSRDKQETHFDCNVVLARTPTQENIHGPYTFASLIRRDRKMRTDETYSSKSKGLYGNDMTDSEKEDFEREYVGSEVDIGLTTQLYDYYIDLFGDDKEVQIEWPLTSAK